VRVEEKTIMDFILGGVGASEKVDMEELDKEVEVVENIKETTRETSTSKETKEENSREDTTVEETEEMQLETKAGEGADVQAIRDQHQREALKAQPQLQSLVQTANSMQQKPMTVWEEVEEEEPAEEEKASVRTPPAASRTSREKEKEKEVKERTREKGREREKDSAATPRSSSSNSSSFNASVTPNTSGKLHKQSLSGASLTRTASRDRDSSSRDLRSPRDLRISSAGSVTSMGSRSAGSSSKNKRPGNSKDNALMREMMSGNVDF
jgi:hypothetical protein